MYVSEGLHPRLITEGFDMARKKALEILDEMKVESKMDRDTLINVSRTSLRTKTPKELSDNLTEIVVDAVLAIKQEGKPIDLHMVEIMDMTHKTDSETKLVRGIVLDHGARHPDMKKKVENSYILTCNVSLEYEKSEVNSGFFYKSAEEREKLVKAERKYTDDKVRQVIKFKKELCDGTDKSFVIINQKGIDPVSLDMLAKEGIVALRRAKKRNMERLPLAFGGYAVNSFDDLKEDCIGQAGLVYEHCIGDDKYTFVEDCESPKSVTILVKGPNKHTIGMIKDAVRDGLRAVKNAIEDGCVVPGAGSFEIVAHSALSALKDTVETKARLGVQAYADSLLILPKSLAQNSGYDRQEVTVKLQAEYGKSRVPVGIDLNTGEAMNPATAGVWDNYRVKRQLINSCTTIAGNLLLVDEVMKAGMSSLKG